MNVRARLATGAVLAVLFIIGSTVNAAIYQQDFEGYSQNDGIGVLENPTGTGSTEWVDGDAGHDGSSLGWRFYIANQNGQRFRAYDGNVVMPSLTQDSSFKLTFWINNFQRGNSAQNVGFVGLFNANSSASSTNGQASMSHFIGINLGGVGEQRDPAYSFTVDAVGGSYVQHPQEAVIVGGFQQWYKVSIDYDAMSRLFSYSVSDESGATLVIDSYTLPSTAAFTVNAFGGSNGTANDGRSIGVYVDDVTIVPEPASLALLALGGVLLCRRSQG